jgi:hypothetical protein
MSTVYCIASNDIYCEQFGNDLVVLNLSTGQYFGFNTSAALIWRGLIEHQASLENLGKAGFPEQALNSCVTRLEELGLISLADHPAQSLPAELLTNLDAALPEPEVELYEDLASLILADPIHDVEDDAGWPNVTGPS